MAGGRSDPALQGGVQNVILGEDLTAMIAGVQAQAQSAENRRRQLAGQAPGLGTLLDLDDMSYGMSVGKAGLNAEFPAVGEGLAPVPYAFQYKSYGPEVPVYASEAASGREYAPGAVQGAMVRSLGEQVFRAQDAWSAAGHAIEVISPAAEAAPRPSLWSRLTGRLRRR